MLLEDAIAALQIHEVPGKATQMRAHHKVERAYWGLTNPVIDNQARLWRQKLPLDERLLLAAELWDCNAHEARICAAKLLTQARIRPDDIEAWTLIQSWLPDVDCPVISDHLCSAGHRRLNSDPSRIQNVEAWTQSLHVWSRCAALTITLPWTKHRNPKPHNLAIREQALGWAARYTEDQNTIIQKAVGSWVFELSRKDPERAAVFLAEHGTKMRSFARKDASRLLP